MIGVPVTEEQDLAIKKALNIDKKDRFQTMAEFYQALYGEALPGEQKKPEAQKMQATQKRRKGSQIQVCRENLVTSKNRWEMRST